MMKVAIVGIQGVPAKYGGFESLVENLIGDNCPDDIQYTIFCSSLDLDSQLSTYKGANLKYVSLHANGISSIPYDIISMCHVIRNYDVILVLGVSGCLFMPILRLLTRAKIIVNIDGLEHQREKWGRIARTILRFSESMAVRFAHTIVADNKGIQDYVKEAYGKEASLIAYGGDHVYRQVPDTDKEQILKSYGLFPRRYAITVCRIEPENNSHRILEAFAQTDYPLLFIGNWNHSEWSKALKAKYSGHPNIHLADAVYDLDKLYTLRSNAAIYIHGHSAGGTNPSLVEAMHFGIPILAWDVVYNRETTHNEAYYFSSTAELLDLLRRTDLDGSAMARIARQHYTWRVIANLYCQLYR